MRNARVWMLLVLLLVVGGWWWHGRAIQRAPGVLAPDDPLQTDFRAPQPPIPFRDARLQPLATFSVTARVLSRENYHLDAESDLSPTDLALGWGRMSDSAVLRHIAIAQGGRFYYWSARELPIPEREIETHSANMHIIPANKAVAWELKRVHAGDIVSLDGLLVEADKPGDWHWRSSMTRDDTGAGACELVYVENLSIAAR